MGVRDYDFITYEEFVETTENINANFEYSNGYIIYMAPSNPIHNLVLNNINIALHGIIPKSSGCKIYIDSVAVKFETDEEEHQFEPDIMVTCDNHFSGAIYKGIPTLVVEILSRATKERDLGVKLDVYEKFGVNEYWIVDINNKEVTIYNTTVNGKYHNRSIKSNTDNITYGGKDILVSDLFDI